MRSKTLLAAAMLLFLMPSAQGHAAPEPRDFETRILHDHNDDSLLVLTGKHGFDAIALDAREARLDDGRPALVLRLLLNGGCDANAPGDCPELSHVVTFQVGGTDHAVAFRTSDDGQTWSGDADRYVGPTSINDGTRFAIEGWVPMADLGIQSGAEATGWFVEGYAGTETADNMPQGATPGTPDPLGAAFDIGTYTVGDPDGYLRLDADATQAEAQAGDEVRFPIRITNALSLEQTVDLRTLGLDGRFEQDGAEVQNVTLAANFTRTVDLVLDAPDQSAPVAVVATTPLGGYATLAFEIQVAAPQATGGTLSGPDVPVGATWSHTFRQAGTFSYHNHHEPATQGTIKVEPDQGGGNHTIVLGGAGFDPETLTVSVGDTVTWSNEGNGLLQVMGGFDSTGGHGDHEHEETGASEDAPGLPVVVLAVALVGLAATRRFR